MIRLILLLAWLFPLPAFAAPLVADLSNYSINIDANFTGTRLFLFGVRNDSGDIVAVIRGPRKDYVVRRKEEVAGLWINRERMKFLGVPDFYAIASSRPLNVIEQYAVSRQLGIGQMSLLMPPPDPKSQAHFPAFADAFLRHQYARRLYTRESSEIQFVAETLFKTAIEFPDDIPPGNYTAEVYLLSDGQLTGMQSMPIKVMKSGLDEFLYRLAHDSPALYGLAAIALALGIGWLAGRIFEKI